MINIVTATELSPIDAVDDDAIQHGHSLKLVESIDCCLWDALAHFCWNQVFTWWTEHLAVCAIEALACIVIIVLEVTTLTLADLTTSLVS